MKSRISSPAAMRLRHFFLIHDIGLGGVLASPAFRRRQEDLGRMATEAMTLVQVEKIRPTAAEQITLEAIPKALERLPGGMSEAKLLPEYKAVGVSVGHMVLIRATTAVVSAQLAESSCRLDEARL